MIKFIQCETRQEAIAACPWATVVIKVYGGYMAFEFFDNYEVWKNQK